MAAIRDKSNPHRTRNRRCPSKMALIAVIVFQSMFNYLRKKLTLDELFKKVLTLDKNISTSSLLGVKNCTMEKFSAVNGAAHTKKVRELGIRRVRCFPST